MTQPPLPIRPDLKSCWLLDPNITFLNHGSFGAVPRLRDRRPGRVAAADRGGADRGLARRGTELIADAKRPSARGWGWRPDDFGLVTNATEGVNAVLRSLDLAPGDELLTTTHVYNAVRQAMQYAAGRAGATYREVDVPLPVSPADADRGRRPRRAWRRAPGCSSSTTSPRRRPSSSRSSGSWPGAPRRAWTC